MSYIALIDIGDYKKGDKVPDEKAEVWMTMYLESPVKKVDGIPEKKEAPKIEQSSDALVDDYLNRPAKVVKNAIKTDKLEPEFLGKLLEHEKKHKDRPMITELLEEKMEEFK